MMQLCHSPPALPAQRPADRQFSALWTEPGLGRAGRLDPTKPLPREPPFVRTVTTKKLGDMMTIKRISKMCVVLLALTAVAACGGRDKTRAPGEPIIAGDVEGYLAREDIGNPVERSDPTNTIWDIFKQKNNDLKVSVNRYIWNASLEVLNFMPVESVDPFTGVIVMGYGTPPGGGQAYRATVYIKDPALEARSLVVALQTRGGRPVSASTQRAIEDAVLSRARQLRIQDKRF